MSTDYYFKKWNEVLKHLERITAIDVDLQVRSYYVQNNLTIRPISPNTDILCKVDVNI